MTDCIFGSGVIKKKKKKWQTQIKFTINFNLGYKILRKDIIEHHVSENKT